MYIRVRVAAGAKKEKVEESAKGGLKISVKEPAERGLANRRVLTLVARHLGVAPAKVRLIKGHRTPAKVFEVKG